MNESSKKWVACWGNATSITDRKECTYAKNLTLTYPIHMCFAGSQLRLHFSNLTGTENVKLDKVVIKGRTTAYCTFDGKTEGVIYPGEEIVSDPLDFDVKYRENINVSIYLKEATQMNAGTLVTGPLSRGYYTYGDYSEADALPPELTRNTNWFYFLNTIDVYTSSENHALICYGDSITAQSWPDYLTLRAENEKVTNISIIRRAVCGTRILRQYDSITYQAYGLKGSTRFPIESQAIGADAVLIQHGINDIIHPVGVEKNPFRPWSDMPTTDELVNAVTELYISHARQLGLKVFVGTLLPIEGWRTYAPFREEIRNEFNEWIRTTDLIDGCIDFDKALKDAQNAHAFASGFDSGDHLHPSEKAYSAMADIVPLIY